MPSKHKLDYDPTRNPSDAWWVGANTGLIVATVSVGALLVLTPVHFRREVLDIFEVWGKLDKPEVRFSFVVRLLLGLLAGFAAGLTARRYAWKHTPLSEPFQHIRNSDPRVYYGEAARLDLERRMREEAGADAATGLYLAPHLAMPRSAETKNILVVGAPGSGKSNIIRALADQSIERGDRVLLLCNKGDVTASFEANEAVLIAAHHRDSFALDLAADIDDAAGAQQFAADIIPASSHQFWSDSARIVLTDIIIRLQSARPGRWDAATLLHAAMSDSTVIMEGIREIAHNAGPMIAGGDEDKTAQGILLTMRSAALANLRPLAWAWTAAPAEKRFSVKNWLKDGDTGPRTVIVQYSADYTSMSSLVIGSLIRRIAKRISDPQLPVDPARRVVLVLDEFHLLEKIEDIDTALGVGREKGLVLLVGIQAYGQLIDTYGETVANKLLDLFGFKIFGRLYPGDSSNRVVNQLGHREVSALVMNRTPAKDDRRDYVEERKTIPAFSATQLASELGVFVNPGKTGDVRAVVQSYGQTYVLDWPFTIWRRKRPGFVPATWLRHPPGSRQPKD